MYCFRASIIKPNGINVATMIIDVQDLHKATEIADNFSRKTLREDYRNIIHETEWYGKEAISEINYNQCWGTVFRDSYVSKNETALTSRRYRLELDIISKLE